MQIGVSYPQGKEDCENRNGSLIRIFSQYQQDMLLEKYADDHEKIGKNSWMLMDFKRVDGKNWAIWFNNN